MIKVLVRHLDRVVLALLLLAACFASFLALQQVQSLQSALDDLRLQATPAPKNPNALLSVGLGGDSTTPYSESVGIYPDSTLYPQIGAPSIKFHDQNPFRADQPRDFEIGFYRYGPTWFTHNFIVEFWIGNGNGGIFSVAGNNNGGGVIQVRNPTDTDSIELIYTKADQPVITTEHGVPLHLSAKQGMISDSLHTFNQGMAIPTASGFSGQVTDGKWANGALVVPTSVVQSSSLVIITPTSRPRGQWWISNIKAGESFTVSSSAPDEDMRFNWLIVDTP